MTSQEIIDLRKTLGMSQVIFAEKLGVSFATVNRWENGRHIPSPLAIEKIRSLARKPLTSNQIYTLSDLISRKTIAKSWGIDYGKAIGEIEQTYSKHNKETEDF